MSLCKECNKVFTNPKGLAKALKQNNNITGGHHGSLEAFHRASKEGCHVCTLVAVNLVHHPSASGFRFTLGTPGGKDLIFRLFFDVGDGGSPRTLTFRLYPFNEGKLR